VYILSFALAGAVGFMAYYARHAPLWRKVLWFAVAFACIWLPSTIVFGEIVYRAEGMASTALDAEGYGERALRHDDVSHCWLGQMTVSFIAQGGRRGRSDGMENHGFVCVLIFCGAAVHESDLPREELPDWEPTD
jgi:hypothetical protein